MHKVLGLSNQIGTPKNIKDANPYVHKTQIANIFLLSL